MQSPQRFHAVDALRGVAALLVLLFHLVRNSPQADVLDQGLPAALLTLSDYARSGVAIFFVISGFVITYSVRALPLTARAAGNFALRRQVRLDPPYYVVIAVVLALELVQLRLLGLEGRTFTPLQVLTNMVYLQDVTGTPAILGVAWTLCIEIQFYLVLIAVMCVSGVLARSAGVSSVRSRQLCRAVVCLLGLGSMALPLVGVDAGPWFLGSWWMFVLGMIACWRLLDEVSSRFAWTAVAIIAIWCALLHLQGRAVVYGGHWFALAAGSFILVLAVSGHLDWRIWRPLLRQGAWSYSLYLVHLPVIAVVMGAIFKVTGTSLPGALAALGGGLVASLASAGVLHHFVEKRSIGWTQRLKRPTRAAGLASGHAP